MVAFGYLGFKAFEQDQQNLGVVFFGLALLFQPIFKISLGREIWNIVDVIVGVWLIYNAINQDQKYTGKSKTE